MFNDTQPCNIPSAGRIVVIGDVHGDVQRFMKCLYACNIINTNLQWIAVPKDTVVVQLGDQVDSLSRGGTEQWETASDVEMIYMTDRLDGIARVYGGRVLSLLGNHELMNVMGQFMYVSAKSVSALPLSLRHAMFKPGGTIAHLLAKRNVIVKIGSHLFCHGGIIPAFFEEAANFQQINYVTQKFLKRQPLTDTETQLLESVVFSESGILWTRLYMDLANSDLALLQKILDDLHSVMKTKRLYVGHNTVQNISFVHQAKLVFADASLSRAYTSPYMQVIDIRNPDTDQEEMLVVQVSEKVN